MPSIVSPVKQKVPLRCRPLRPITEQRLACTKAFCDRVAAVRAGCFYSTTSFTQKASRRKADGFRDRVNDPTATATTSIGKHLTGSTVVVRASRVSKIYPCRVAHAGLTHEVAKARALDTMAHCRERKRSRGSHGEVITETKHGPCLDNCYGHFNCTIILTRFEDVHSIVCFKKTITKIDKPFAPFAFILRRINVEQTERRREQVLPSDYSHTSIEPAHAVIHCVTHITWTQITESENSGSYISGLATGQRMTTRYSRREGAPLQEWNVRPFVIQCTSVTPARPVQHGLENSIARMETDGGHAPQFSFENAHECNIQ
ncbi:hypothetical protein ALC57_07082 [Trachymyrmex cornetzi]|uniref:Uncharacterized protein n=1 Tax=Trachymyrmex cornetzi TaxID=471704 RepID=A0A195E600_9HYME|nr:hypothetical protein ALC57_07082 [Trachymyrmex cornetzi]